jgi:hypothetical protein
LNEEEQEEEEEEEAEVYYYPSTVEVEDYEEFYLEKCSACNKPLCYSNGWADGGRLCFDCADVLSKKKKNGEKNTTTVIIPSSL